MEILKWFYPGLEFKRWLALIVLGTILLLLGVSILISFEALSGIEIFIIAKLEEVFVSQAKLIHSLIGLFILLLGGSCIFLGVKQISASIYNALSPNNNQKLVDLLYQKRYLNKGPEIVVVGGGTGLSTMLRGLKKYTTNITAIVTVADDGGSSGVLRNQLGMLPPGDIRNCLVALADRESLLEELFQYRFQEGEGLSGHSFGNLFIATMTEVLGDFEKAVKESSKVLAIRGQVLPSSLEDIRLEAKLENGKTVRGESKIGNSQSKIKEVAIEPKNSKALPEALTAIKKADAIILGPGSLYTSILPNLLLKDLAKAIKKSSALKTYVCNVMTQPGETDGYTASDHLQVIDQHIGAEMIDVMLVNNQKIDDELLKKYRAEGSEAVKVDQGLNQFDIEIIKDSLIDQSNLVRHNPAKLAEVIVELVLERTASKDLFKF